MVRILFQGEKYVIRHNIKKIPVILLAMIMLTACGTPTGEADTNNGENDFYGTDEYGDAISLIPSEDSYIFRKADGRVGRGTYDVRNSQLSYDRFIYDIVKDGDDKFILDQNGSSTNDSAESLDGYVFTRSDGAEIAEYDNDLLDGVWVSDTGVRLEIDMDISEYNVSHETGSGMGTVFDNADGKGVYLFTDDFAYVIWNDQDNIAFESSDPVYANTTFTREADSYGEEYDDG